MKSILAAIIVVFIGLGASVSEGAVVFSDDFNRATLNGGTYTYTTTVTAGDGAAGVSGDMLQLSNDGSAAANANGRVYTTTPTSAFGSPFNSQLNQNGLVTWTFNMRQIRDNPDPSGFAGGGYGVALVLGATSSDLLAANGYAVVLGNVDAPDPIRLVTFTGGLDANANLVNIIAGGVPLDDIGADYLSLQVTYNPSGDTWSLSGRNDGTASFADPTIGALDSVGTVSDATYTGSVLTHFGFLWNYSTAADQTARFDNVSITAVPEPAEWGLICAVGLLGVCGLHTWRERRCALRQSPSAS